MSDYPMLISNKLHSFRNFRVQNYLVLHTFPKMVVGSCCNFYKHRIRLKKCNESDLFA